MSSGAGREKRNSVSSGFLFIRGKSGAKREDGCKRSQQPASWDANDTPTAGDTNHLHQESGSSNYAGHHQGTIGRWLRELRPGGGGGGGRAAPKSAPASTALATTAPSTASRSSTAAYRSFGKASVGGARKKSKDKRRHSFNEREDGGSIPVLQEKKMAAIADGDDEEGGWSTGGAFDWESNGTAPKDALKSNKSKNKVHGFPSPIRTSPKKESPQKLCQQPKTSPAPQTRRHQSFGSHYQRIPSKQYQSRHPQQYHEPSRGHLERDAAMTTARSAPNLLHLPSQHRVPLHSPSLQGSATTRATSPPTSSPAPLPYSAPPTSVPSIFTYLQSRPGLSFASTGAEGAGGGAHRPPAPPVRDASSLKLKTVKERCELYPQAGELNDSRRMLMLGGTSPEEPLPPPLGESSPTGSLSPSPPIRSPPYPFPLPRVDRDGKPIGDSDYAVPSPPERDTVGWTNRCGTRLTQADLEEYARTYEETLVLRQHQMMALQQSQHAAAAAHMMLLTSLGGHHNHSVGHHGIGPVAPHHAVGGGGASSASSSSYAHSEGYHSYVSSCDSSASHTPFLDRLRRESEANAAASNQRSTLSLSSENEGHKSNAEGREMEDETDDAGVAEEDGDDHQESSDSVCDEGSGCRLTHGGGGDSGGSGGGSSSGGETLKWHGSVGDVSVASSSISGSSSAAAAAARQLIAHSAKVKTPQRHHSESVLYLGGGAGNGLASSASSVGMSSSSSTSWQARVNRNNALNHKLKMFPVNTYTVQPPLQSTGSVQQQPISPSSPPPADQTSPRTLLRLPHSFSVAERIHELEKQSRRRAAAEGNWNGNNVNSNGGGYTYLDPEKRHRVSDPTLKAIQKKALLSYYERHHRGGMASSTCSDDRTPKYSEGNGVICSSNGTWRSEQQQAQPQVPTSSQQHQMHHHHHQQQMSPTHEHLSPQHQLHSPTACTRPSYEQKDGHSQHILRLSDGRSSTALPSSNDDDPALVLALPQPRVHSQSSVPYSRRSSSASDYLSTGGTWREHFQQRGRDSTSASSEAGSVMPRHEHSASCGSLPGGELGPLILGPPISLDHWVPERPPKKPHLRAAFSPPHHLHSAPNSFTHLPNRVSDTPPSSPPIPPPRTTSTSPGSAPPSALSLRCPSPDDPPPPPPPPLPEGDDELVQSDEPLPPPPPNLQPPNPISHDLPSNSLKSSTSRLPVESHHSHTNGTTIQFPIQERHFFGDNFNPSMPTKSCSPPPRPQQLQPWQMSPTGDAAPSNQCNHSQSTDHTSPSVPVMGVPAIRTLVKSPNQGFATSQSVSGRERPPVMSRARACMPQLWKSADLSSESLARTSPKSPPTHNIHENNSHERLHASDKETNGSEKDNSVSGSQSHRRPNHWQVPLKPVLGRRFSMEYSTPSNSSLDSVSAKSPNRLLDGMNVKNSISDENKHGNSRGNGVGESLIEESEGVEDGSDSNSTKMKSGKFQSNLVGKAVLRTQSKSSSYLSTYHTHHLQLMHRRGLEKGTPNFEGSYKRTLSPPSGEPLLSKQQETTRPLSVSDSNNDTKNSHHQHVAGWVQHVPETEGNTLGMLNNFKGISDGVKGGRRSRLDHSWVKGSWTEDENGERKSNERVNEMEEDTVRRRGRESSSQATRSLTSSSSSSSSSTVSSFSISSTSTASAPRSPMSITAYETTAESWVMNNSSPGSEGPTDVSVVSGKTDAASQTESVEGEVESDVKSVVGQEKGSIEEKEDSLGGEVEKVAEKHSSDESAPSSPPPSPPKSSHSWKTPPSPPHQPPPSLPTSPLSVTEEAECERLSRDLVSLLPPTDRLQGILAPTQDQKRPTDYVSGLFRLDVPPRPRSSNSSSVNGVASSRSARNNEKENGGIEESCKAESKSPSNVDVVQKGRVETPLPATSVYFTTSEPKARFLARYGRDVGSGRTGLEQTDSQELQQKKEELMSRLSRKLEVLREEAVAVNEEAALNEDLGKGVADQLGQLALPHEISRFKLHVDEVGKVTSLLLALSGRLARAENALALEDMSSSQDKVKVCLSSQEERKTLEGKRDKLRDQLEEAKQLKASIDRRSGSVSAMLARYLDAEAFADYGHFITMKAKLIVDAREVSDKIKLGEEQLAALRETLLSSPYLPTTLSQTSATSSADANSCQSNVPDVSKSNFSGSNAISLNSTAVTTGIN